ncbi:MAG: hypothetical protein QOD69_2959 [Solirubrobacteraceae bacterium]|jgi:hypothetical protein|nr:hypothetical protein [Solirubrobacteraceae bacterium]
MRTRVVSIITWPLRFLRRLVGLLARSARKLGRPRRKPGTPGGKVGTPGRKRGTPLRKLGTPVRKLGTPVRKLRGLRGRPRIAAFVILGVVVVVVVLALRPGPDADKEVRATLDRYATATRLKDYQTLCDSLFARNIVDGLRSASLPCEVALRNSTFETLRNPQLTVLGVEVSGDQALARTRTAALGEAPSVDTIKLVRQDGGWRIASLAEPGSGAAPGTP